MSRSNAYFIRGLGQVQNLDDIRRIVVKNSKGSSILIEDIATVQFGSATRYGAVTRNGEGEVVARVPLMSLMRLMIAANTMYENNRGPGPLDVNVKLNTINIYKSYIINALFPI
ncbi:MAG: efflux RND transporter permease subunit [Mucilaginibacter sp.]